MGYPWAGNADLTAADLNAAILAAANGTLSGAAWGAGVATFLATPSSANLAAAVTDETGSGALVFGTAPALSGASLSGTTSVTSLLRIGATAGITGIGQPMVNVAGLTFAESAVSQTRFSADTDGAYHLFAKSRGATQGTYTAVNSGDTLGRVTWYGADGTQMKSSAQIIASADGAASTDIVPGRLSFWTSDTAGTVTEREQITSTGLHTFGGVTSSFPALKPNGAELQVRLANDSGPAALAATLTNSTGLPISTGVSGLGSGVATFLGTPSSANLAAAVTGETGSGGLVFDTGSTLSGATLSGTTALPGSGQISSAGWIGFGSAPAAQIDQNANVSAAAWATSGIAYRQRPNTYTDTSSAGTVAAVTINSFGAPTLAASGVTTYTLASSFRISAPLAGANVTLTNSYAIHAASGGIRVVGGAALIGVTYANRPAAAEAGTMIYVTDSNTATWRATVAGGGANKVIAWFDGTNWLVQG